jgi:hypothetical protein
MNKPSTVSFFASKPRVVHMALNIALAPVLLYLLGVWAWPPVLPHYIVFVISGLMALQYARRRWKAPRLVLNEEGLYCDAFYPTDTIYRAEASLRSVTLTILKDGEVKEKIIALGWASKEDYRSIVQLLSERFQREVPK